MSTTFGSRIGTDYFFLRESMTVEQKSWFDRTRRFVDAEVIPVMPDYWDRAEFPRPVIDKLGPLGLVGGTISGYGCPGMDPLSSGLVSMELSRGDGSLATFVGVQGGLAMASIALLGSAEQKQRWLPEMAALRKLGAFALTEPDHGSDSIGLETSAQRSGDTWTINGRKKWIGNGSISDVTVVWARDTADGQVKGFLVDVAAVTGYEGVKIEGKGSLRSVWQAEITLTDVKVDEADRLPGARSFADCARVLTGTRQDCAWMALGLATAGYDAALAYAKERKQFGKPLAAFQIVQERLVKMLADITAMQLYCVQIAHLAASGRLEPTLAGLAKLHNTSKARTVLAAARDMLGGNGILLDRQVIKHMADIEAVHTFEGTETMQTLIVGRDITGLSAFA